MFEAVSPFSFPNIHENVRLKKEIRQPGMRKPKHTKDSIRTRKERKKERKKEREKESKEGERKKERMYKRKK